MPDTSNVPSAPPPGRSRRFFRRRWATLLTLLLGYVGYYLCRANLQAATPLLKDALQVDLVALGWVSTVSTIVYGVGKFTHGFLAAALGGRRLFLIGLAGAALFSGACGLVNGLWGLVFLWSLNRFVQAGGWVGMVQIAAQWYPRVGIGTVMSVLSLSWLVGDVLARGLAGAIVGAGYDWRMVFFVPAALVAVQSAISFFTLAGSPEAVGEPPLTEAEAGEAPRPKFEWGVVATLMRNPQFHILALMSVLLTAVRQACQDWSSTHFVSLGLSAGDAMSASSIFPAAGVVGTLGAGLFSDFVHKGRRAPVCLFLLACLAAGLTALALVPDPSPALATALWGVCGFGLLGPFSLLGGAVSVDVGGRNAAGVAAGVVDGIGYVAGAALGGVGAAAVVQARGWSTAFGVMAAASALAVVAAWRLTRAEDRARAAAQRAPAAGDVAQENVG